MGGTSGGRRYFWPLVSRRVGNVHKCQRALRYRTSSTLLHSADREQFSSRVCGQFNSDSLSSQSGGHTIPAAQCHRAADSAMVGVSSGDSDSAIRYGSPQCLGGLSVSTQSDLGFRVDSQGRSISGVAKAMAGGHRLVCHLTQSPMLPIFFSVPRSERYGHGCSAPELEWVAGVCLSSLVAHSSGTQEAPVITWSPPDHHSSVVASEALVPGPSGSGCGRSGSSSSVA